MMAYMYYLTKKLSHVENFWKGVLKPLGVKTKLKKRSLEEKLQHNMGKPVILLCTLMEQTGQSAVLKVRLHVLTSRFRRRRHTVYYTSPWGAVRR